MMSEFLFKKYIQTKAGINCGLHIELSRFSHHGDGFLPETRSQGPGPG